MNTMFSSKSSPITLTLGLIFFLISFPLVAQQLSDLEVFNAIRLQYNMQGMLILGSWAFGNIIWGLILSRRRQGNVKAFHQMNVYWNLVNLAIAVYGYLQAAAAAVVLDQKASWEAQQEIEQVLWINAGLDLVYLLVGYLLIKNGKNKEHLQRLGFGQSILMQGAFLFVFDLVLYGMHQNHFTDWASLF